MQLIIQLFPMLQLIFSTIFSMNLISQKRNTFQVQIRKKAKEECFKAKRVQSNMSNDCNTAFQIFLNRDIRQQIPQICAQNYQMISPALIDKFLMEYAIQFQTKAQISKVSNISFLTKISLQKGINFSSFFNRTIKYCVEVLKVQEKQAILQKCCRQLTQFNQQILHEGVYYNCMMQYFGSCFIIGEQYEFKDIQIIVDSLYVWIFNQDASININYFSFCFLYREMIKLIKLEQIAKDLIAKIRLIGETLIFYFLGKGYFSVQYLKIIQGLLSETNNNQQKKTDSKFILKLLQKNSFRELIKIGIFCDHYVYNKKKYLSKKFQNGICTQTELKLSIQTSRDRNLSIEQEIQEIQQSAFNIFQLLSQLKYDFFPIPFVDQVIHQIVDFIYKKNRYEENAIIILYNILLDVFHYKQYQESIINMGKLKQIFEAFFIHQFNYERLLENQDQKYISLKFDLFALILEHIPNEETFKKIIIQVKLLQKLRHSFKGQNDQLDFRNNIETLIQIIFQNRDIFCQYGKQWKILIEQLLCLQIRLISISVETQNKHRLLIQQLAMNRIKQ